MSVLDASAAVELLLVGPAAGAVRERLVAEGGFSAPETLIVDVLMVLRRDARRGVIDQARAGLVVADLLALPVTLFSPHSLAERAWSLRDNFTVADALYVTLAEATNESLLTADRRLARAAADLVGIDVVTLST